MGAGGQGNYKQDGPKVALVLKNPPANAGEIRRGIQSLSQEDPLEEGMATHSSILAWRIPLDRGAWWATVHRVAKSRTRLKRLSNDRSGPGSPGTIRLFPGWLAPHRPVRHRCLLLTRTTLPLPQVVAERVLCPAAREPWLLQGCEGSQCRSAVPRRSACQPGQGLGQRGL